MTKFKRHHLHGEDRSSCPTRRQLRYSPRLYQRPRLVLHGSLGELIRGASWKGVDSVGELDPDQAFPG